VKVFFGSLVSLPFESREVMLQSRDILWVYNCITYYYFFCLIFKDVLVY